MQKIHVEAALKTAKTISIILLVAVVVSAIFVFMPMSLIMAGLGIVSLVIATKATYDHYVWKIERQKIDNKSEQ